MDALHDLLRALHLTGGVFLEAEFTEPWCVISQVEPAHCAPFLPQARHVIAYHYLVEGQCQVAVEGHPVATLRAGEIVLLPRNEPHRLGSALNIRAVDARHLIQASADGGPARISYGGGGHRARMLCGFLGTTAADPPIARVLPAALTLAVEQDTGGAWIASSFQFATRELATGRPGSPAVVARLAELLLIEAVRRHVATLPSEHRGWLAGVRDPVVGRALALVHGQPGHRWTVTALAREAGASRSAFAERFTSLIGESPMHYLARQRLHNAGDRLRTSDEPVGRIALDVGYQSEAAFSRAFRREFGRSPAAWRKQEE